MFKAPGSPYRVPDDGSFDMDECLTLPRGELPGKSDSKKRLKKAVKKLAELQEVLYADDRHSVLLVFQAMDAAGKDSTIRAVLSGVNPAGCQVFSFKRPSHLELDHDYLWRTARRLPQRGRIGVFNRSYYEEVLAVRVHPEYLDHQKLPHQPPLEDLWQERFESIRSHEQHLARNGTLILKFWLNVSLEEQRQRFLSRLNEPEKHWKFSSADIEERELWPQYMEAYAQMLRATSTAHAPWYAIPADDKPYMRATVAEIIVDALQSLDLKFPTLDSAEKQRFQEMRERLGG